MANLILEFTPEEIEVLSWVFWQMRENVAHNGYDLPSNIREGLTQELMIQVTDSIDEWYKNQPSEQEDPEAIEVPEDFFDDVEERPVEYTTTTGPYGTVNGVSRHREP
jgi:hypothetical protein